MELLKEQKQKEIETYLSRSLILVTVIRFQKRKL